MRRLPPLRALEAFVRTVKLGSAKAAANELAISAPALSRRIKALEDFIGKPLFDRKAQAMAPNAEAQRLLETVSPALDAIADAIEAVTDRDADFRLKLGVLPLFGSQRLIPNLGELRRLYPKLHIDVITSTHAENLLGDAVDAAIIIASEVDEKLYSRRLDTNNVYAITSHEFAKQENLKEPRDLEGQTVFVHSEMPRTFEAWRAEVGLPDLKPASIDHMDSGPLMLEAAAQGLGVAIMHGSHFSDARDERLMRLFDIEVRSPYSYWFVCRPRALERRAVRVFHDWLVRAQI